jgi:5-methylcytosine-specific restriction endonuclease McrA
LLPYPLSVIISSDSLRDGSLFLLLRYTWAFQTSSQVNQRVALLLKRQKGICPFCRLFFKDRDLLEIDYILSRSQSGLDEFKNLQLLHRYCHDAKSAKDGR